MTSSYIKKLNRCQFEILENHFRILGFETFLCILIENGDLSLFYNLI